MQEMRRCGAYIKGTNKVRMLEQLYLLFKKGLFPRHKKTKLFSMLNVKQQA